MKRDKFCYRELTCRSFFLSDSELRWTSLMFELSFAPGYKVFMDPPFRCSTFHAAFSFLFQTTFAFHFVCGFVPRAERDIYCLGRSPRFHRTSVGVIRRRSSRKCFVRRCLPRRRSPRLCSRWGIRGINDSDFFELFVGCGSGFLPPFPS